MLIRFPGRVVVLGSLLVLLVGCSNRTAQVTGMVSVDGQPIEKGSISFVPVDGQGTPGGSEIKDGKYTVTKVSPGSMKVQIRYPKATGEKKKLYDTPESKTREVFVEGLPAKYNTATELRFDVQPGKNEKNWELSLK